MTRALIYTRVSSAQQADDGTSLDTQEARCRAYCAERDYQVIGVHADTHTGIEYRQRPGLSALREQVRAGVADVVVCYAVDRLSRHQAHIAIIVEEFEDYRARLELVTEDFEDSAVGRFIRSARAFAAEIEHEKIKERTTRGKLERVRSGKLLPTTKPLYGYQWRDDARGQLDIDPLTAPVVERIYHDYAGGATLRGITTALTDEGIPTPTGKSPRWQYTTVRNILLNPAYKGRAYGWGWRRAERGESQTFDYERAIALPDGTIPPIVDAAIWEMAQERLALNKQRAIRNARDPEAALLRGGYAVCGYCGWTMSARPRSNGRYEYVCGTTRTAVRICPRPTIVTHTLDAAVWDRVRAILLDPSVLEAEVNRRSSENPIERDREYIDRQLADLERQRANTVRAITLADDPDLAAPLVNALREITERQRTLNAGRAAIAQRQADWDAARQELAGIHAWRERVAVNIDTLAYADKRLLLDLLGIKVSVWRADHAPRYQIATRFDRTL